MDDLVKLRRALVEGDAPGLLALVEKLRKRAHGARPLTDALDALEARGLEGTFDEAWPLVERAERELSRLARRRARV